MKDFLLLRLAIVPILFGAFGNALQKAIEIEGVNVMYTTHAALISLATSLMMALLAKNLSLKKMKVFGFILFLFFLSSIVAYSISYDARTFEYKGFEDTMRFLRGDAYTTVGDSLFRVSGEMPPEVLLRDYTGGPAGLHVLWTEDSLRQSKMLILSFYTIMILFFSAFVSFVLEFVFYYYSPSKPETGTGASEKPPAIVQNVEEKKSPSREGDVIEGNKGTVIIFQGPVTTTGGTLSVKGSETTSETTHHHPETNSPKK